MIYRAAIIAVFSAMCLYATPAMAAPEEVQVYMDEINQPGEFGLDLHISNVLRGDGTPSYLGEESSLHRWRITPEFSYGLTKTLELGAYLPLATIARDGVLRVEGAKMRLKWLAPHRDEGVYYGVNWEVGKVGRALSINPWNSEVKLIGGWRKGRWNIGFNGNIGFTISGPQPEPASFELATKLGYKIKPNVTLGVESFNGMGDFKDLGHLSQNEHTTYLTLDTQIGKWDINAGIGQGYGTNADHLVMKFVIGVPIGR